MLILQTPKENLDRILLKNMQPTEGKENNKWPDDRWGQTKGQLECVYVCVRERDGCNVGECTMTHAHNEDTLKHNSYQLHFACCFLERSSHTHTQNGG